MRKFLLILVMVFVATVVYSSENNAYATYDYSNRTIHIPYFAFDKKNYWIDLKIINFHTVDVEIVNYGINTNVNRNYPFAVFDLSKAVLHIPNFELQNKIYWLDFKLLSTSPKLVLRLQSFGVVNKNDGDWDGITVSKLEDLAKKRGYNIYNIFVAKDGTYVQENNYFGKILMGRISGGYFSGDVGFGFEIYNMTYNSDTDIVLYVDKDLNADTGYKIGGIGADYKFVTGHTEANNEDTAFKWNDTLNKWERGFSSGSNIDCKGFDYHGNVNVICIGAFYDTYFLFRDKPGKALFASEIVNKVTGTTTYRDIQSEAFYVERF